MNTLIFRTVAPFLTALMALFSIFVLLRGHNEPGGGFIGGAELAGQAGLPCGLRRLRHRPQMEMQGQPRNRAAASPDPVGRCQERRARPRFGGEG